MIVNQERAVELLNLEHVVAVPTETVYGLAARIDSESALKLIFLTKNRPFFDPLIVHVASLQQALDLAVWTPEARLLAERFWPGPLTLILEKNARRVSDLITSGLQTVGLRMPNHPVTLELIASLNTPIAAPSANLFAHTSPTTAEHVEMEFGGAVSVVDGGSCAVGIESTIVRFNGNSLEVLRPGWIAPAELAQCLGWSQERVIVLSREELNPAAPGQLKHHYMPAKPLIVHTRPMSPLELSLVINQRKAEIPTEFHGTRIQFVAGEYRSGVEMVLNAEPRLATRELYAELRRLAQTNADFIHICWPYDKQVVPEWQPLWDRLHRAASLIIE